MTIYAAVINKLLATPAITAIVGNRIWPLTKQQATADEYILVQLVSGLRYQHISGSSDVARVRLQLTCASPNFTRAMQLRDLVEAALYPFSGVMGGAGGIVVQATELAFATDRFEPDVPKMLAIRDVMIDYETA